IRNHFNYRFHFIKKKMKFDRKKIMIYIIASLFLSFSAFYLPTIMGKGIFQKVLFQGIQLGGWVFLWEAFTLFFLNGGETRRNLREYERLVKAPIKFRYK